MLVLVCSLFCGALYLPSVVSCFVVAFWGVLWRLWRSVAFGGFLCTIYRLVSISFFLRETRDSRDRETAHFE